jgi:hypothetical protein
MHQGQLVFAQLIFQESLRDIESSLRAQAEKLYHLGIRGNVSRNTLANANATCDRRIGSRGSIGGRTCQSSHRDRSCAANRG